MAKEDGMSKIMILATALSLLGLSLNIVALVIALGGDSKNSKGECKKGTKKQKSKTKMSK